MATGGGGRHLHGLVLGIGGVSFGKLQCCDTKRPDVRLHSTRTAHGQRTDSTRTAHGEHTDSTAHMPNKKHTTVPRA